MRISMEEAAGFWWDYAKTKTEAELNPDAVVRKKIPCDHTRSKSRRTETVKGADVCGRRRIEKISRTVRESVGAHRHPLRTSKVPRSVQDQRDAVGTIDGNGIVADGLGKWGAKTESREEP